MSPKINDNLENLTTPNGYQFSALDPNTEDLGASEYTLVTIVQDASGSVADYADEMINCIKTVVQSCQRSPRSENLMLRLSRFSYSVEEFHGFRLLNSIDSDEYDQVFDGNWGMTALYDSVHTSVDATLTYGKNLTENGVACNAVIFIVTDGNDNRSNFGPAEVKKLIENSKKNEDVEGVTVILIGITGGDDTLSVYLDNFKNEANIDQYVDIGDADEKNLARLAKFISRSVSSSSQQLASGSGGTSQLLDF